MYYACCVTWRLIILRCRKHQKFFSFSTHLRGSIKFAPLSNLSDYTVLLNGVGDSLKDIEVFSKAKQTGVNPCKYNNGGCAELCLFNGTHPVCQCAHGQVAKGGKTCEGQCFFSSVMVSDTVCNIFN